jgi:ferric-chelate reductase
MHEPVVGIFAVAAAIIYGIDTFIRLVKTRITTATLTPCGSSVRVSIPLGSGWRAGHHVRIRVLSSYMGLFRWAEAHPFTVASASGGGDGLELLIQPCGTWTQRLAGIARAGGEGGKGSEKGYGGEARVRVIVEGPYGGVGHARMAAHGGALFVCGGSGISFALGALGELAIQAGNIRHFQLVWSVPDPAALAPHLETLRALLAACTERGVDARVRVHYTRALTDPDVRLVLPPHTSVHAGRPPLPRILHTAGERVMRRGGSKNGFYVAVCGPAGLGDGVARAVGGIDPALRNGLGGVEFHRE